MKSSLRITIRPKDEREKSQPHGTVNAVESESHEQPRRNNGIEVTHSLWIERNVRSEFFCAISRGMHFQAEAIAISSVSIM